MSKFVFEKGSHKPNGIHIPGFSFSHSIEGAVMFDESCVYPPADWENDTNKLDGFTLGLFPRKLSTVTNTDAYLAQQVKPGDWVNPVHYDSARIVWRPAMCVDIDGTYVKPLIPILPGRIEVFLYLYEQGIRRELLINTLDINHAYAYKLSVGDIGISVTGLGKPLATTHNFGRVGWGYRLNPLIGGNSPAVQRISLKLNRR